MSLESLLLKLDASIGDLIAISESLEESVRILTEELRDDG